jgi:hypothetical protein
MRVGIRGLFVGVIAFILLVSGSFAKNSHQRSKNAHGTAKRTPLKQPPTPQMTRQMSEDAEIEAYNKKKIAEQEAERELKQLYQQSIHVKPIGAKSTILFLGHDSISTPAPVMEADVDGAIDAHFVSFFQQGLAADDKDVNILYAPLDHRDIPRMLQIFSDEPDLLLSSQDALQHVVLVVGHEFVTDMDLTESKNMDMVEVMHERRALLEQVIAHFKQRAETQVVLVGLLVHGEDVHQSAHPHRHAFEECSSMLEQVSKVFEIAFIDLTSVVETFQRKLNVEQLPHSLLTVDGQHLSVAGHAFVATHLLRSFHQSSVPVSISGHVARLIVEKQAQHQQRQTVDQQLHALAGKEDMLLASHSYEMEAATGPETTPQATEEEPAGRTGVQPTPTTRQPDTDDVFGVFSLDATLTANVGEGETLFEL